MEQKTQIVIIAIALILVMGIIIPEYENMQKYDKLTKASDTYIVSAHIILNMTEIDSDNPSSQKQIVQSLVNLHNNYTEELNLLQQSKESITDKTELEYVDLIIKQTQLQINSTNQSLEAYLAIDKYQNNRIDENTLNNKLEKINNTLEDIELERNNTNTKTKQLIDNNPKLKDKIKQLGLYDNLKYSGNEVIYSQ